MKRMIPMALAIISTVMLSGCETTDGPGFVRGADEMTNPRFARRTWVIYRHEIADDLHLREGDAFRLRHRNRRQFLLIPLRMLRMRWGMEGDADDHRIPLVVGSDGSRLCGMVEIKNHADIDEQLEHLLVLMPGETNNQVEIDLELFDETRDLMDQCDNVSDTHRGRAHGEN